MLGTVALASVGVLAGLAMNSPSYSISTSLIKRRVPQTVQTSNIGQAFRPVDLNDATLLATLLASEPLDLTVQRAKNGLGPDTARNLVEAAQLQGTDIFYITYHSPFSATDAISFSKIWAQEINEYTKRFQQTEAREVRTILQNEVASLNKQLATANQEILDFSTGNGYLGSDSQVVTELSQLGQIELQLSNARVQASTKTQQIENLRKQIRRQSPIELQLKSAQEELANLRATYTDANPLVQAKLQSIAYLEEQIQKLSESKETDLEFYTGTPLGNQLYLDIVGLENELLESQRQIESLEKLRETTAERINNFPAIINGYQNLIKRRDSILEGLSLLTNRLQEAEIFASGAPGYWQVFQSPDKRLITSASGITKPLILGTMGAGIGGAATLLLCLIVTRKSTHRSVLECCVATRAPLLAMLPADAGERTLEAVRDIWLTHFAPRIGDFSSVLVWTSALDPEDERKFWSLLSEVADDDQITPLHVRNLSTDTIWSPGDLPSTLSWKDDETAEPPHLLRASSLPPGKARSYLENVDYWMTVVTNDSTSLDRIVKSRLVTDTYLHPCDGTIAWSTPPAGPVAKATESISRFITKRLSQQGTP